MRRIMFQSRKRQATRLAAMVAVCLCIVFPLSLVAEEGKTKKAKHKATPPMTAMGDPRGEPDLTVCSQNLKLFGGTISGKKGASQSERARLLVQRFLKAECDVIAVQEVMGRTSEAAQEALAPLVTALRQATNRIFKPAVAPPIEGGMTVAFLVAKDRAEVLNSVSYSKVELPRLSAKQKPRMFSRTPFEIQLSVLSKGTEIPKTITIVNFHFKSKRGGQDDPTGLEWETYRMEMAEALRRILERRHSQTFASGESLLLALGDRNSNFDVASAHLLDGSLALSKFQGDAPCRLSKRGVPLCRVGEFLPRRLFSVLIGNPSTKSLPGTFRYRDEYSWLDEILMPAESLPFAWKTAMSEGNYSSGVVYEPEGASDHALVWVRLNWG